MNKKVFLGALLFSLVLPMATGCGSNKKSQEYQEYKDNSESLNKTSIGEASINNINKYTAIGVGKLDKKSLNQKYKLIANQNNDDTGGETENDGSIDLSNTLVGLTSEGVLEELSLTIQSGQQLNSSSFTITYYQELGDFVLVSVLPMSAQDYIAGVESSTSYKFEDQKTGNAYEPQYKEMVALSIAKLDYPLKYSIRYLDATTNEYKYIDTSYLIHKRSGKLFPFSNRRYCVDAKKCKNGEFRNPSLFIEEVEGQEYAINSIVDYEYEEMSNFNCQWVGEDKKPELYIEQEAKYFHYNWTSANDGNSFPNGILIAKPKIVPLVDDPFRTSVNNKYADLFVILFNERTSSLEITNLEVNIGGLTTQLDEDHVTIFNQTFVDKFGNFVCKYKGRYMAYNINSKQFIKADVETSEESPWEPMDRDFDRWTRQYFYRGEAEFKANTISGKEIRPAAFFLNANMEEDYHVDLDHFYFYNTYAFPIGNILLDQDEFEEKSSDVDEYTRLIYGNTKIYKYSLDNNGHYNEKTNPTQLLEISGDIIYHEKNYCYYVNGLDIHKVVYNSNTNTCEDGLLASLNDYPYVDKIWHYGNGIIAFEGIDSRLNTVTGYVYPDGTISFNVEEFGVYSQTTILSPIN